MLKGFFIIVIAGTLITGCITRPQRFTPEQTTQQLNDNLQKLKEAQQPAPYSLSLHNAIARSFKYNLDYRVQLVEEVIAHTDMRISNLNMLPNLVARAGYIDRSNTNEVLSPTTGQVSTAEDRRRFVSDLNFSWNILDFGVSYFESQQKADLVLVAEQKKRKTLQRLAKDTRIAFWRDYAAVRYRKNSQGYVEVLKDAISKSSRAEQEKVISALDGSRYRRDLWNLQHQAAEINYELIRFHPQLLSLINAPLQSPVVPTPKSNERVMLPLNFPTKIVDLEKMALSRRPELVEENYRKRVSLTEIKKARLRLLPGVEINYGDFYDSNSYLVNNNWALMSLTITWNILKAFANYKALQLTKEQTVLADFRRLALSLAIITQVDIAYVRYHHVKNMVFLSAKVLENEEQIYRQIKNLSLENFENKLMVIKARGDLLNATLRHDLDYAEMQNAAADLMDSVGFDPINLPSLALPLPELTQLIDKVMSSHHQPGVVYTPKPITHPSLVEVTAKKKAAPLVKANPKLERLKPKKASSSIISPKIKLDRAKNYTGKTATLQQKIKKKQTINHALAHKLASVDKVKKRAAK